MLNKYNKPQYVFESYLHKTRTNFKVKMYLYYNL